MYEYKKKLKNKDISRGLIPIGNVIQFFMDEPKYIQKKFHSQLIQLITDDLSFTEKQDLAHKMVDDYFEFIKPKPGYVV